MEEGLAERWNMQDRWQNVALLLLPVMRNSQADFYCPEPQKPF